MSVAEWADTYGVHHWRILRSSYRKLAWVGFEPTITELRSDLYRCDVFCDLGPLAI